MLTIPKKFDIVNTDRKRKTKIILKSFSKKIKKVLTGLEKSDIIKTQRKRETGTPKSTQKLFKKGCDQRIERGLL